MASLSSTFDSDFTPAAGSFSLSCTGGPIRLVRKNPPLTSYAVVGDVQSETAVVVDNPSADCVYQVKKIGNSSATFSANQ
mgnify:CR=1 FL=1